MTTVRIFRHYVNLKFLLLGIIELLIFFVAFHVSSLVRFGGDEALIREVLGPLTSRALVFSIIMVVSMLATGLYQNRPTHSATDFLLRFLVSLVFGSVVLALVFYLVPNLFVGRGVVAIAIAIAFAIVAAVRGVFFTMVDQQAMKRRVAVIGTGRMARAIEDLQTGGPASFIVVGFIPVKGETAHVSPDRILVGNISEIVTNNRIEEIVVALEERRNRFPVSELINCKSNGVPVVDLPTFFERETGAVPLEYLNPSWIVFSDGWKHSTAHKTIRRAMDIAVSCALLLVAWPVMLLAALAILLESGRPVFYKQRRVGLNGRTFEVIKLRSMVVDAEKDGKARWADEQDERVTRVGVVIRNTRIDELPQLFNVIAGDMSFVGPRPERPEFVAELSQRIPYYVERHRVKPGITGWAQLRYQYTSSEEGAAEKLKYDLYYVKNNSIFLDTLIMLQTAEVILWCRGAR